MSEAFKLPSSSYEELIKIIKAYSSIKNSDAVSLDDIAQSAAMQRTVVSGNNGFLVQVGLLNNDGNKKSPTSLCTQIGRAYIHKVQEDIITNWKAVIEESDFLSKMVSAIRIRNGMDRTNLVNHIVYSSGQNNTKQTRAGANAIIEIIIASGMISEVDGKLTISDEISPVADEKPEAIAGDDKTVIEKITIADKEVFRIKPATTLSINLNINCSLDQVEEAKKVISELVEELSINKDEG